MVSIFHFALFLTLLIQGVPPKLSGVRMGIWPLKCVRFSNPIPVSENLDREKFSSAGSEACLLINFFRNLRSKKHGQNHKKRTPISRFFMILTTLFRSQITKKKLLINKLPCPRWKISLDPNFPKLVSDLKIRHI